MLRRFFVGKKVYFCHPLRYNISMKRKETTEIISVMKPAEIGLTQTEAEERLAAGLGNSTKRTGGKSYASIFVGNIFTFFNLLGLAIMILMAALGSYPNLFFGVIIIANTTIGIVQEIRAKRTIDKLSLLNAPQVKVIRDGREQTIDASSVVRDDIIKIEAGNQICADCVLLEGQLETDESLLTGESEPVRKAQNDTLLSGSFAISGSCLARVEKVGAMSYVQTLAAKAKKYQKPKSELMRSINAIIKVLAIIIFPLGIATFFTTVHQLGGYAEWRQALIQTSGSMIGMIPSGLVLLTSVALTVSVIRLASKKAMVKDLYCIEMLARVNVLCLDKTGTITDGTMTVETVLCEESELLYELMPEFISATGEKNQTARALENYFGAGGKLNFSKVVPFSSARKYSAVSFNERGTLVVGAPEFVPAAKKCMESVDEYAKQGKRVLLVAFSEKCMCGDELPDDLVQLGLLVLKDTVRPDAIETIKWFKENDVLLKVISGDNPQTVSVIAKEAGVPDAENFVSLDGMTDEEVVAASRRYTVFGRVNPEQKALLIKQFKLDGKTVAMTGDGVNDILAMKEADCAVAMGAGSQASKSVAHLVLFDSKFSSMPSVVAEGRRVVNNIQNSSSLFLMKTTMTIFTTLLMICLGREYPFEPRNLYLIEFLVIGLPSFFLALKPNKELITGRFISNTLIRTIPSGLALSLSVGIMYLYESFGLGAPANINDAQLMTLSTIAMTLSGVAALCVLCYPFNWVNLCVALGSAALVALGLTVPFARNLIGLADVKGHALIVVIAVAVSVVVCVVGRIALELINNRKKTGHEKRTAA